MWNVFIINSVEQLQTLPKTQSEIDISPFLKTQKPSSSLFFLKVNNSGAAKVEYLTLKNIKIQLPAISRHVRLPQSSRCLYKNYIQIGRLLRNPARFSLHFNYRQRYARKDNLPSTLPPDLHLLCRTSAPKLYTVIYPPPNAYLCSGGFKGGRGLWGLQPPPPLPSNKSSTNINISFSRLVSVMIWLLIEWFRSVWWK